MPRRQTRAEAEFEAMRVNAAAAFEFLNQLPFGTSLQVMLRNIERRPDCSHVALLDFAHRCARQADHIERAGK